VTPALVALCLLTSTDGVGAGAGVDRDADFLAPFLGRTLVDAEDLARDAVDPLEPRAETGVEPSLAPASDSLPLAAPLWAAFLPSISIELIHREVRKLSGTDILGLTSGTVVLLEATFGLSGNDDRHGVENERGPAGLRVSLASLATSAPQQAPAPAPAAGLALAPGMPTIAEVQKATERAALVRLEDLEGWRGRARASAWLPELGISYQRNVGEIDTLGIQSNLGIDSHDIEDVARYGARATWQLGQLVFSREEVTAAKAALEVQRDRQQLVAHVTELYFEWLRVRARASKSPEQSDSEASTLKLAEITAQIDALTDGFLSRRLSEAVLP
jgi:hypothetical protein